MADSKPEDSLFGAIDWQRPWLVPFRSVGIKVSGAADWRQALNAEAAGINLRNHQGLPVCFVPQHSLPSGVPYERFISETGCVPTRENLHDFFNALVWLTYPGIKIQLNALQAAEIEKSAAQPEGNLQMMGVGRGRLRDAATIFDENATLMLSSEAGLIDALRAHDWNEVFITRRDAFISHCELRLFGHALIEKLLFPYKAITTHAWPILVDAAFSTMSDQERRQWLDEVIAHQLTNGLKMTDFTPLPVLGVPGWWLGQNEAFYTDGAVFRPKKS